MAETPTTKLEFKGGCPDCGARTVTLPGRLPAIGDDLDRATRDHDGFRLTMLEDLTARFPDRRRWTPGDLEVVIVEVLASALDELSHDLDRLHREAFLETARSPASVRRLLSFIGYNAVELASNEVVELMPKKERSAKNLDRVWLLRPELMEAARAAGPDSIHTNRRMVTAADHGDRLRSHPLVLDAAAASMWTGSWTAVVVAAIVVQNCTLETPLTDLDDHEALEDEIKAFHAGHGMPEPSFDAGTTIRVALRWLIDAERIVGREVVLRDAVAAPISMALSVRVARDYFVSEIRQAVEQALGTEPGGYFAPGERTFGEDLRASDFFETVGSIEGIESVCLNRFKRMGAGYPDRSDTGVIRLDGIEVARCDNTGDANDGLWTLLVHGGRPG